MATKKRTVRKKKASIPTKEFTEAELQDLRTAFVLLDRNGDGQVTAQELQFMLQSMGIDVRDDLVVQLMCGAAKSESGLLNEAEFLQWVGRIQALLMEPSGGDEDEVVKDLVAAFKVFDRDSNGYITKDELRVAMDMIGETVTEGELNDMLAAVDTDRDGKINYEEFARSLL